MILKQVPTNVNSIKRYRFQWEKKDEHANPKVLARNLIFEISSSLRRNSKSTSGLVSGRVMVLPEKITQCPNV